MHHPSLAVVDRVRLAGVSVVLLVSFACGDLAEVRVEDQLVVLNKAENTVTILDRISGEKLATVVTGVGPHEAAAHSRKALLVTANYGTRENPGSSLTVVDLRRKRAARTIDLERYRRPHGIQFFQDGERVIVTAEEDQAALIVNIETEKIEKVIPTGQQFSHMVALSPEESRAYVSNIGGGSVSALDVSEGRLLKVIPTGAGAEGIAVSPDAADVWVTNRAEDTISIIDVEALEAVEKIVSESFPLRLKFTPDGEYVLVSNARSGDVAVFSVRERKEVARIPMDFEVQPDEERFLQFRLSPVPIGIAVSDDGLFAYVSNANADLIAEIDLTEWKVVRRLDGGHEPDGLALAKVEVVN